jgi:spermidine synthase
MRLARRVGAAASIGGVSASATGATEVAEQAAPRAADTDAERARPGRLAAWGALLVLCVSGLCSLIYEVAWSRLLSQVLGSSVYAFSAMLTTFLIGIAAGSYLIGRDADRSRRPVVLLACLEIGIGVFALIATPLLDRLPLIFIHLAAATGGGFAALSFVHFLFAALVMIVPTLLMGATFPVAARIFARDLAHVGSTVGTVYSWNTVGAIAGAFLGGFLLLPSLGMRNTIVFAAGLNVAVGALYLLFASRARLVVRVAVPAVAAAGVIAMALLGRDWDRYLLNFGAFDSPGYWRELIQRQGLREVLYSYDMRFYQEGLNANVAVSQEGQNLFLQINGRTEASTTSDMQNQLMAAHIPLLLHPEPREAALVGLGSGITLGSMLLHPLRNVDCVEISPEVVEAAGYFTEFHYNALADPRVRMIQDDGRNVLMASDRKYDVLISEPSKPWITGVSNLFTREYYRTCLSRLDEDGIMCQWCHYYSMSPEDFRTIVRTFCSVFPYVQLWNVGRDVFLLGSKSALPIDADLIDKKFVDEKIRFDLARVEVRSPFEMVRLFMLADGDLREYVGAGPVNTDDRPIIEFSAPRNLSVYKQEEIYLSILSFRPRFIAYPLLRQITELANGRGFAFPLAGMQYLTRDRVLTPKVAGIVRTTQPQLDPQSGSPIVSFRREAFFDTDDGGGVAFAAIERIELGEGTLDSTLQRLPGQVAARGETKVRDHPARWVATEAPATEERLLGLSWHCPPNRAQYFVTRRFTGSEQLPAVVAEAESSSHCFHGSLDPSKQP